MAAKRKRAAKKRVTPKREAVPHQGGNNKPHDANAERRARVRVLAMIGYTQQDCADDLKIHVHTFVKYYLDDFDQGNSAGKAKLLETGYQKAVGREAKYSESGKLLLKELPSDTPVLISMLRWRVGMKDTVHVEIDLAAVLANFFDFTKVGADQMRLFHEILELARKDRQPADQRGDGPLQEQGGGGAPEGGGGAPEGGTGGPPPA